MKRVKNLQCSVPHALDDVTSNSFSAYLTRREVAMASCWGAPAVRPVAQAAIYTFPSGLTIPAMPLNQVTSLTALLIPLSPTSQSSELACARPTANKLLTYLACRVSRDAGAMLNMIQTNIPRTLFHTLSGMRQTVTQRLRNSSSLQTAASLRAFLFIIARAYIKAACRTA